MQFKENAAVVSADGKDLGHVRRIVLDPRNDEVKDLVVRKGTLLSEDRVVPLELVRESNDEKVQLNITPDKFEQLYPFEETFYVSANGEVSVLPPPLPAYYLYPPVGGVGPGLTVDALAPEVAGYAMRRTRNVPENSVALKPGVPVKGSDSKEIGKVDEVLTAANSDKATHIVLSEGLLHKTHRAVPLEWIANIEEREVRLNVPAKVIEKLPEYQH